MRTALTLLALAALAGCSSSDAPAMSKSDEAKALKGGPMPAGTWDKIAAARQKYNQAHGGGGTSPAAPTGG